MVGKRAPTAERFLEKFTESVETGCWEWSANKNNKGYGLIWSPEDGRKILAHRFSYRHFVDGNLGPSQIVLHSCDNPGCVNPSHLSAGSKKDNMTDCGTKERLGNQTLTAAIVSALLQDFVSGVPRCDLSEKYSVPLPSLSDYTTGTSWRWLHGQNGCPTYEEIRAAQNRKPGAKVTAETAAEIRSRLASGELGKDLAREYGIHKATISDIKLRKIWAEI